MGAFLIVTDGLKNAKLSKNVNLELFDPQVRFLTLAADWRTFWILTCTKQGFKPARDHPAANQKLHI